MGLLYLINVTAEGKPLEPKELEKVMHKWNIKMHFRLLYFSTVSTEKTFELLVELWNDETNQEQPFDIKFGEVPLSPGKYLYNVWNYIFIILNLPKPKHKLVLVTT